MNINSPFPTDPEKWQAAYTADNAYYDTGAVSSTASLIGTVSLVMALLFSITFIFSKLSANQNGLLILGIAVITSILVYAAFKYLEKVAFRHAEKFFVEFYLPPEGINASEIINYRLGDRIKLPMPFSELFKSISQFKYVLVQNGDILNKNDWPAWLACNIGGPILLIVFDGSALYIERGNHFSRVVGPGVSFLERYETIKYAVDLRTKSKTDSFAVWTKDGITIKLTTCIEYRIGDPQKISAKPQLIYPYDPISVKKAIERYALRWPDPLKEPGEFTWEDAAWGQVTGIVPDYIGSRFLDDILVADCKGGQILSPDAANEIFSKLNNATKGFGVYVTNFQILSIEVPPEVKEHYVQYWEAESQSITTIKDGKEEASNIRTREKTRAETLHDLILAIADGLEKNKSGGLTEALLFSLPEVLDHSLNAPDMRSYTGKEILELLEKVQSRLERSDE